MKSFAEEAKALNLTNEQAQKVLDRDHATAAAVVAQQEAELKANIVEWEKQVKADQEIGGDKMDESLNLSARVLKRFGSDALIKSLNETGLGSNPEVIRLFSKIGRAMSDDQLVVPGSQPTPSDKPTSLVNKFYKDSTPDPE